MPSRKASPGRSSSSSQPGFGDKSRPKADRPDPGQPATRPKSKASAARRPYVPPLPEDRSNYIPPVVSSRMVRRVALFAGIPTLLGISSFGINYALLVNHVVDLPPIFTLVETLALFGLGFVGISYGVLSASWEEDRPGSRLGLGEFRANLGSLIQQWREFGAQKRAQRLPSQEE